MENTKILKQTKSKDIEIDKYGPVTIILRQSAIGMVFIQRQHLPELIELLKSELEVNNG